MRSLALCLAAGLLASLAFVAPTQAGSIVETEGSFTLTGGGTASDLEFTYSAGVLPTIGNVLVVSETNLTGISASYVGNNVLAIDFNATASGAIVFKFLTSAAAGDVFLPLTQTTGVSGPVTANMTEGHLVSVTPVPEPASFALLGIGMASFLTFRRLFKRPAIA
jgi:hypothetical protein